MQAADAALRKTGALPDPVTPTRRWPTSQS
jgi:hypothetical protein